MKKWVNFVLLVTTGISLIAMQERDTKSWLPVALLNKWKKQVGMPVVEEPLPEKAVPITADKNTPYARRLSIDGRGWEVKKALRWITGGSDENSYNNEDGSRKSFSDEEKEIAPPDDEPWETKTISEWSNYFKSFFKLQ